MLRCVFYATALERKWLVNLLDELATDPEEDESPRPRTTEAETILRHLGHDWVDFNFTLSADRLSTGSTGTTRLTFHDSDIALRTIRGNGRNFTEAEALGFVLHVFLKRWRGRNQAPLLDIVRIRWATRDDANDDIHAGVVVASPRRTLDLDLDAIESHLIRQVAEADRTEAAGEQQFDKTEGGT